MGGQRWWEVLGPDRTGTSGHALQVRGPEHPADQCALAPEWSPRARLASLPKPYSQVFLNKALNT